jgi:ribosomal protein L29
MSVISYRKLTKSSLTEKINNLRTDLEQTRFDVRVGKDADTSSIKKKRKELSRMLTVHNEKEALGEQVEEKKDKPKSRSKKETT